MVVFYNLFVAYNINQQSLFIFLLSNESQID
jgi:hypothetical protein